MKKLGKLTINPEKVIKNEELVNLRGGYGEGIETVNCFNYYDYLGSFGIPYCPSYSVMLSICQSYYPSSTSAFC